MWVRDELPRLCRAAARVDSQTAAVLVLYVVFVLLQFKLGGRRFFFDRVGDGVLQSWAWWFGAQGFTGFVLPVAVLTLVFRRRPGQIGLTWGDTRFAGHVLLLYAPLVLVGTWFVSVGGDFQDAYPHYRVAARSWTAFALYHGLFLVYWVGWEYLWRGFVLFGTAHTLGVYAIFVQAIPFALLHLQKPVPELALSIVGGIVLGAVVWRCRSFWIAVPLHALQMVFLDMWCTLRLRTGIQGVGPRALWELVGSVLV